jgi:HEAT repeat protein
MDQFRTARTAAAQLGVVNSVVEAGLSDAQEFYLYAFGDLVRRYQNISGATELYAADEMAIVLSRQLGEGKNEAAGSDLWRAQEMYKNGQVKRNLIEALGKIGDAEALPKVVQLLQDLNFQPHVADGDEESTIATGCIIALESYGDPVGYLPVYFASKGWYRGDIKRRAETALTRLRLEGDSSGPLLAIIQMPGYPYTSKLQALQVIEGAQEIPDDSKSKVSVAALNEGWIFQTQSPRDRRDLASLRLLAINMIAKYGTDDPAVYPLLEKSLKEGIFPDEQIGNGETRSSGVTRGGAINALVKLKTDDSARLLESFLTLLNTKRRDNNLVRNPVNDDYARTRVAIVALGNVGKSSSRAALSGVISADWEGWIQNLARQSLRKLQ